MTDQSMRGDVAIPRAEFDHVIYLQLTLQSQGHLCCLWDADSFTNSQPGHYGDGCAVTHTCPLIRNTNQTDLPENAELTVTCLDCDFSMMPSPNMEPVQQVHHSLNITHAKALNETLHNTN